MADLRQNIIVDFVVDDESLAPAIKKLQDLGIIDAKIASSFKQTTAELNKQINTVKNVAGATAPVKKNLEDISKATKQVSKDFMIGFQEGIIDTLQDAGVSLEQFEQAMDGTGGKVATGVQSIRAELRQLVEEIARAKANGQDYGESYDALVLKAGKLKDAISDVNQEIGNVASDTSAFDGMISIASGVAGAFSVAQGAVALFGDENEELQETLLKVNAAMAIAQGLQQVQTVLQKESAAARLADLIVTKAQTVAMTAFNFVVGTSTGLLKAFRIALATTGVGLIVIALIELVNVLTSVDHTLERVNNQLERNKALLETDVETIEKRTERLLAAAKVAGKAESDLIRIRREGLLAQRAATVAAQQDLIRQRDALESTTEGYFELNKQVGELGKTIDSIDQQLFVGQADLIKQVAEEAKEAGEKAKKASQDAATKAREARDQQLQDEIAGIERKLLVVEKGTREELKLQQDLVAAKANLDLNAEKLTQNEILLIKERSLNDQLELSKEFAKSKTRIEFEGEISKNNAELSALETNNDKRLQLQIENINFAAAIEIEAAQGNALKIEEINAKADRDILETKKRFIEEAVEYEIALETAKNGSTSRALERIVNDERAKKELRINAARELARLENEEIDKRMNALDQEYQQRLISDQDYILKYEQLLDKKRAASETSEAKITDITIKENEKRRKNSEDTVKLIIETAGQVVDFFDSLARLQTNRENARIEMEKKQLDAQLEAGQITEKEAIARNKRLEAEERKNKTQQAQRDKQLAIFKAVVNTAIAVTNAITTGDPYTAGLRAAIVAAIGAAEIAVISRQPIPRFAKGKKKGDSYEGLGYVGEAGTELIERNGKLFVASKPTIVYLGPKDVVYTPQQTKAMMSATHKVDKTVMSFKETVKTPPMNYDEMAKAIGKHVKGPSININKDFISESIKDGLSIINHHSKYYSYPK